MGGGLLATGVNRWDSAPKPVPKAPEGNAVKDFRLRFCVPVH